jgi:glutathione S-transferase
MVGPATTLSRSFLPAAPIASGMTMTLYRLEGCPYCELVVDRIEELDIDYESVWVEGLHSRRNEVKRISGQRQVPVVVDEDRGITMAESDRILEYLDQSYA